MTRPVLAKCGSGIASQDFLGPAMSLQSEADPMTHTSRKMVEIVARKTSLMPCILDDDPGQLNMLSAVIVDMGYEPIPMHDPKDVLKFVQYGRCQLLLADFHMPGMRRYEFLDQVLRCDPGVHVIVMTKEYTLETALEAIRRGAADFLPKPVDRARLKETLDEVAALNDQ